MSILSLTQFKKIILDFNDLNFWKQWFCWHFVVRDGYHRKDEKGCTSTQLRDATTCSLVYFVICLLGFRKECMLWPTEWSTNESCIIIWWSSYAPCVYEWLVLTFTSLPQFGVGAEQAFFSPAATQPQLNFCSFGILVGLPIIFFSITSKTYLISKILQ